MANDFYTNRDNAAKPVAAADIPDYGEGQLVGINGEFYVREDCCACGDCGELFPCENDLDEYRCCDGCAEDRRGARDDYDEHCTYRGGYGGRLL